MPLNAHTIPTHYARLSTYKWCVTLLFVRRIRVLLCVNVCIWLFGHGAQTSIQHTHLNVECREIAILNAIYPIQGDVFCYVWTITKQPPRLYFTWEARSCILPGVTKKRLNATPSCYICTQRFAFGTFICVFHKAILLHKNFTLAHIFSQLYSTNSCNDALKRLEIISIAQCYITASEYTLYTPPILSGGTREKMSFAFLYLKHRQNEQ